MIYTTLRSACTTGISLRAATPTGAVFVDNCFTDPDDSLWGQGFCLAAGLLPGVPERGNRLINWHCYFLTSPEISGRIDDEGLELHLNLIDEGTTALQKGNRCAGRIPSRGPIREAS